MTQEPSAKKIKEEFDKIINLINFQEKISSEYIARIRKKERLIKYLNQYISIYKTNNPNQKSINNTVDNDQDVTVLTTLIEDINDDTKNKKKELAKLINKLKNYQFVKDRMDEKKFKVNPEKPSEFFDFLVAEYLSENERLRIKDQIYGREDELDRMKKWEETQQKHIEEQNKTLGAGMLYKIATEDGRRSERYIVPDRFDKFDDFKIPYVIYDDKGNSEIKHVDWNDHTEKIEEFVECKSRKIVLENGGSKFSHLPAYDICIRPQIDFCEEVEYETVEDGENETKKKRILGYRTYCTHVVEVDIEDLLKNESIEKEYPIPIQIDGNEAKCKIPIDENTSNGHILKNWNVGKTNDGRTIYDTVQVQFKSRNYPNAKIINLLGKRETQDLNQLTPREDGITIMAFTDGNITYVADVPTDITENEIRRVIFAHNFGSNGETLLYTKVKFCGVDAWKQKCVEAQRNDKSQALNAFITSQNKDVFYGFLVDDDKNVKNYRCPTKFITAFNKPIPVELGFYLRPNQKVWRMVHFHRVDMTKASSDNDHYISFGEQTVTIDLDTINNNGFKQYNLKLGTTFRIISIPTSLCPGNAYDLWIGWDENGKKIELVRLTFLIHDKEKRTEITKDNFISDIHTVCHKNDYPTLKSNKKYPFTIKGSLANGKSFNIDKKCGSVEVWKNTQLNDYKLLRYYVGDTIYYRVFHFVKKEN